MAKMRAERLAELIKQEISDIIFREVKDPRIGFLSITDVEVSGDLRNANIYVSVYGTEEERKSTLEGLEKAKGFIRKLLGERITVYHTPELSFHYDQSIEYGAYINKLLDKVKEEDENKGDQ
ncbi:MAG: 30S ribosome-binding factor RbfA [Halanaerobiales bacterium]